MKITRTLWLGVSIAALTGLSANLAAQEFPPYPEQQPLSESRQGPIAEGQEDSPNGGRPQINSVEEMLEVSGYTSPGALKYAALAAEASDGIWGVTSFYRCKNTPGGTALNAPYPVPLEVFDGVYSIGDDANNIWAIETSEGIILLDALGDEESAHAFINGNMLRLGLDPKDIKLILISHGHGDHTGGLKYMRELTGAPIGYGAGDYDAADENLPEWAEGDFLIEDGQQITLGDFTMTAIATPGHTPGTTSFIFPVTWNGEEHVASYFGGQGSPSSVPDLVEFRSSIDKMSIYNDLMQADVVISNHTVGDDGLTKIAQMAADPSVNPYIVGRDAVTGYHEMWRACLSADIDQKTADGEIFDPVTLLPR